MNKYYTFSEVIIDEELFSKYCLHYIHFNCSTPLHSHSFYEINIILEGNGKHFIEKNKIDVKKGDFFVIPPNIIHGYQSENLKVFHLIISDLFMMKFQDDFEKLPGYIRLFKIEPELRQNKLTKSIFFLDENQLNDINRIIKNYIDIEEKHSQNDDLILLSLSLALIYKLCSFFSNDISNFKHRRDDTVALLLDCMSLMNTSLEKKHTVADLSKMCFMSTNHFIKEFHNFTGNTPMQYLNICRLKKAKEMLENSDISITRIAQDCGFFDSCHFTKNFKTYFNILPKMARSISREVKSKS